MADNTDSTVEENSVTTSQHEEDRSEGAVQEITSPLVTEQGTTSIEDRVLQKITVATARSIPGVHAMGSTAKRALSSIAERLPGASSNAFSGVNIQKGEVQVAISLSIVVEYGYGIVDLAENMREKIIDEILESTGFEVVEVNIDITDIHMPDDDDDKTDANNDLK